MEVDSRQLLICCTMWLGDEGAADAVGALGGFLGPDGFEVDAHGRKNGDVENGENVFGEIVGGFEFESDAAEAEVEDASAAVALVAEDGVSVGAGHGDAFGSALNSVDGMGFGEGFCASGHAGGGGEIRRGFFGRAAGFDGDWLCGRRLGFASRSWRRRGIGGGLRSFRYRRGSRRARRGFRSANVVGVLEVVEAIIGDVDQLVGLLAVLWVGGDAVVHANGDGKLKREKGFREDGSYTAAEGYGLGGVGLRKKESEFIATDAEGGIGSAESFAESGGSSAKDIVAAWVAVLVVDFLEAVKVEDDEAERGTVAVGAVQFLFEGLGEEAAVIEAGERIGDGVALKFLEVVVLDDDGNAEKSCGSEDVHQGGFESDGAAKEIGELALAGEHFVPELNAVALAQIEMGDGAEVTL
jgi:hypothetical protein